MSLNTPFQNYPELAEWLGSEEVAPEAACPFLPPEQPPRLSLHILKPAGHGKPPQQLHLQPPVVFLPPSEAPTRRMSTKMSTLASIDELEPLLFDPPSPQLPRMNSTQAAQVVRSITRSCPAGALSPCPNSYSGCVPSSGCKGELAYRPDQASVLPLPHLPPIATRVGQKPPQTVALVAAAEATPKMGLKIRTPRRHFGLEEMAEA